MAQTKYTVHIVFSRDNTQLSELLAESFRVFLTEKFNSITPIDNHDN